MVPEIGSRFSGDARETADWRMAMAIEDRLDALEDRRQTLDALIRKEMTRPGSNDLHLVALKRQKLALKDQIESLRRTG